VCVIIEEDVNNIVILLNVTCYFWGPRVFVAPFSLLFFSRMHA
jgi:hypothetical protein